MPRRRRDERTGDLFAPLPERDDPPGCMNLSHIIPNLLADAIKESPHDRFEIAARMSRLTGTDITKAMLDAWTSSARRAWRFPLEFTPAFEAATSTHNVSQFMAERCGGRMIYGREVLEAQLGRFEMLKMQADREHKRIRDALKGMGG